MVSHIARKMTTATALVALTAGGLGAGLASAQGLSSTADLAQYVDVDRVGQLNSTVLGGASADAAKQRTNQSHVVVGLPDGAQPLPAAEAKDAVVGLWQAKQSKAMTLELRADGTLTYDDGCNSGNGLYSIDDAGSMHVTDLSETRVMCDSTTMDNAAALKSVLRSHPAVYELDGSIALGSQDKAVEFDAQ